MYHYNKEFSKRNSGLYRKNTIRNNIRRLGIKFSGIYSYDEEYYHVNGEVEVRLTLIDNHTKVILKEEALECKSLEVIITDGRKEYLKIIEELGAKQHRCYFHVMQTL